MNKRCVAVVKFLDGNQLYGIYDIQSESISNLLFTSISVAEQHLDTGISRLINGDPKADEETVEIQPHALTGDNSVAFRSMASKTLAILTGPGSVQPSMMKSA